MCYILQKTKLKDESQLINEPQNYAALFSKDSVAK